MRKDIAVIEGDYSGPEVVREAVKVMKRTAEVFGHQFSFTNVLMGGAALDATGNCLPQRTLDRCLASDSVLLGAVGGPKWDDVDRNNRPETGLLRLRKGMKLFSNLRPARVFPQLAAASSLKPEIVAEGIDFVIVRELVGGIYFGVHETVIENGVEKATDTMSYSEPEIERILRVAFETARKRRRGLVSVDKSNVLDCSRLWTKVFHRMATDYPDVQAQDMLVDNAAMQIVRRPSQFDVIVTENMFGDILSDEASMVTGSIGLIPSSSLGETSCGLYEPIHGSAPDIAGKNVVNPIGAILSGSMMMKYSFGMLEESAAVDAAVNRALDEGYRTGDIMSDGCKKLKTVEMGDLVASYIS
ncbi:MAG: 3-isopropylmalate dehydrogenase [Pyramidobacter sp.]|uniref:3-isopropylmalate dehydrogenase n=1 Tax=Pyramidobacter sp. TaxID=1943581 RepID=UPI002A7F0136|nr:3-isopropylmalate dehydrogenase [Pyramidobacter sp.]MDY4032078.1 3-isopropylmalate dehydrogenase [Pyramidobacter sp.]